MRTCGRIRPHPEEVGLSASLAEVWRPAGDPYPMPPIRWFRQAELLAGLQENRHAHRAHAPGDQQRVLQRPPRVHLRRLVRAGCPTGALVNPRSRICPSRRKPRRDPHRRLRHARAGEPKGDRAAGVEYYDKAKQRQEQHADVVVLARSRRRTRASFSTPRRQASEGLANSSGLSPLCRGAHHVSAFAMFEENTRTTWAPPGLRNVAGRLLKDSHPIGSYT